MVHPRRQPYVRKSQRLRQQKLAEIRRLVLLIGAVTAISGLGYFISAHFVHGESRLSQPTETVFVKQKKTLPPAPLLSEEERKARKMNNVLRDKQRLEHLKMANGEQDVVDEEFYAFYDLLPKMEIEVNAQPISSRMKHPKVLVVGNYRSRRAALNARYRWARRSGVPLRVVPVRHKKRTIYQVQTRVITDKLVYMRYRELLRKVGAKPYPQWVSIKKHRRHRSAPKKIRH